MSSRRPSQASPLQFELIDLPAAGRLLEGEVTAEELELDFEARREFTQPIKFRLMLSSINSQHDLLVRGSLATAVRVSCDRCDTDFEWSLETDDVCHEFENAFGTTVDLTEDLREDILMAFPQHFLCSDDCKGLCPRCGQNRNLADCGCPEEDDELMGDDGAESADAEGNPWAQLDVLKSDGGQS